MIADKIQSEHNEESTQSAANSIRVQASLAVGPVNDPLEHEADAMADKVMSMQTLPTSMSTGDNSIQRKCSDCEEDKVQRKPLSSFIQRKESSSGMVASNSVSNKINESKGSGNSMDNSTQSFMQSRFGSDFSHVKIHTGEESIQMNRELNAKAFTVGSDIYFNEGQYNTASNEGKHLLAHELTHTIQQGATSNQRIQTFSNNMIQRKGTKPPRKTIWVNIGFDSSAIANEETMKKLKASVAVEKTAVKNCCDTKTSACNIDVKAHYDWNRDNKPAPADKDYDSDVTADTALRDKNLENITAPNGGIKILVTESTLSQTWQGVRIFPRANAPEKGVVWNRALAAVDTIAHEHGHKAGYVGDIESNSHSSDTDSLMSPGNLRSVNAGPDDEWCNKMSAIAV
jgi:hypothetical protein